MSASDLTPTGLTATEKRFYDNAIATFDKMFDLSKTRNLLRKRIISTDRRRLAKLWDSSRYFGMAMNEMHNVFKTKDKVEDFSRRSGLKDPVLSYLYLQQMMGTFLINLESVFRASLIFFLEEECGIKKNMTLGQLLIAIKSIDKRIGTELASILPRPELRNCLAHGTFWFEEGGKVYLANNSYLEDLEIIQLSDFMIETKKANIVAIALVKTLVKKINENYFLG